MQPGRALAALLFAIVVAVPMLAATGQVALGPFGGEFGYGLAFSDAGDQLIVGSPSAGGINLTGEVRIYRQNGAGWSLTQTLTPPPGAAANFCRFGVTMAQRGGVLAISAPTYDSSGAVFIYRDTGQSWQPEGILRPAQSNLNWQVGWSVAVDGQRIFAGAPSANGGVGRVLHAEFTGLGWAQRADILPPTPTTGMLFGHGVAARDGVLAIGAPSGGVAGGLVFVGSESALAPVGGDKPWLGRTVGLADGRLVVGGGTSIRVYRQEAGSWTLWTERTSLRADVTGDAVVNGADLTQTIANLGCGTAGPLTCATDVNISGLTDFSDVAVVVTSQGSGLPPQPAIDSIAATADELAYGVNGRVYLLDADSGLVKGVTRAPIGVNYGNAIAISGGRVAVAASDISGFWVLISELDFLPDSFVSPVTLVPVAISAAAKQADPNLVDAASYNVRVTVSAFPTPNLTNSWKAAEALFQTDGAFYQHPLGTLSTPTNSALSASAATAFDTFVTIPPNFPNTSAAPASFTVVAPTVNAAMVSVGWYYPFNTGVNSFTIGRLTVIPSTAKVVGTGVVYDNQIGFGTPWTIGELCSADLSDDLVVDDSDLGLLLDHFGCAGLCTADIDGDQDVDDADLGLLLDQFGCGV